MQSKIFLNGPLSDEISKFLSVPHTQSQEEKDQCNLYVYTFDSEFDSLASNSPSWASEVMVEVTYLASKMPKSTFILIEEDSTFVNETVRLYWSATGTNIFMTNEPETVLPKIARKVNAYSKMINDILGGVNNEED
jgi:hypothetical protein